jgi:hypothetical protein
VKVKLCKIVEQMRIITVENVNKSIFTLFFFSGKICRKNEYIISFFFATESISVHLLVIHSFTQHILTHNSSDIYFVA